MRWWCGKRSLGGSSNSAAKVTEASLAQLQFFCCKTASPKSILDTLPEVNSFVFSDVPTIARYDVDGTPVIASIWPHASTRLHNWSVLVVLTGNGNDRHI